MTRATTARQSRGQANLVALIGALLALTTALVIGVAAADSALAGERRDPAERHAATAVAERLVSADSSLTNRTNVLNASAIRTLSAADLRSSHPVLDGRAFRVTLDGTVLAADGSLTGGTTMRRLVLVEETSRLPLEPAFSGGNRLTLPRRTDRVEFDITPPGDVTVSTVRANQRTVLHDPDGLDGSYEASVSRRETVELVFEANGTLSRGDVELTVYPTETRKAELAVTVDG